jgi:hypothetical protein
LKAKHDLRRSVPARRNIFCHVSRILFRIIREASRETEVTDLELAVGVDQKVTGLQVSMEDVGGVDILETAEDLVDEGLEVSIGQWLPRSDDGRKIAFHQLCTGLVYPYEIKGIFSPSYRYVSLKFSGCGISISYRHVIW